MNLTSIYRKIREDIERLYKIKANRGLRHRWGLRVRGHTLRPQVVVEQQSVWKERKSEDDNSMPIILLSYTINIQIATLINTKWSIVSISKKKQYGLYQKS